MGCPNVTPDQWEKLKEEGIGFRVKECGDCITTVECVGKTKKTVVYKLNESMEYCNKEYGVEDTRILTAVSPGCYKMVAKDKKNGESYRDVHQLHRLGL